MKKVIGKVSALLLMLLSVMLAWDSFCICQKSGYDNSGWCVYGRYEPVRHDTGRSHADGE